MKMNKKPLTLETVIRTFKSVPSDKLVYFDFGNFVPTTLGSYRGYYNELALGYDNTFNYQSPRAGELLTKLDLAVGRSFPGWKGGEYIMDKYTPVWAANSGEATSCGIVGFIDAGWSIIIQMAWIGDGEKLL